MRTIEVDFLYNVVQSLLIVSFFVRYFKMKSNFTPAHFILWVLICTVGSMFSGLESTAARQVNILITSVFYIPWLYYYAYGPNIEKIFITFFALQLSAMCSSLVTIILSFFLYQNINLYLVVDEYYDLIVWLTYALLAITTYLISNQRKHIRSHMDNVMLQWFILFLIVVTIMYLSLEHVIFKDVLVITDMMLALIGLFVVVISVFILFFHMQASKEKEIESGLKMRSLEFESHLYDMAVNANQETRKINHDLKHFVTHMKYLLEKGQFELLDHELDDFIGKVDKNSLVLTNNTIIDYILNLKHAIALEKGVSMRYVINVSEDAHINNVDMSILLGNLIDNAIENANDGVVEVRAENKNEYVHITVSNAIKESVLEHNPDFKSSKKGRNHGHGLVSVREIIERNEGSMEIKESQGRFIVSALFKES
ncbi:GHKL domain-containing protein [Breznakia blatticola]|uniref:GHKL domain-containing protein n=1 Tax=Breznakia blatticola TaxID=1754012 RepID=A0A4R7ZSR2_9FIRM|nr:sensor histidine kinase [Breznakia blatticola]TDW20546.1 GHKL domain-containing protein [Breznakia blatticola]